MQAAQLHPNILLSESESRRLAGEDVGNDGSGMQPMYCAVFYGRLLAIVYVRSAESDTTTFVLHASKLQLDMHMDPCCRCGCTPRRLVQSQTLVIQSFCLVIEEAHCWSIYAGRFTTAW